MKIVENYLILLKQKRGEKKWKNVVIDQKSCPTPKRKNGYFMSPLDATLEASNKVPNHQRKEKMGYSEATNKMVATRKMVDELF